MFERDNNLQESRGSRSLRRRAGEIGTATFDKIFDPKSIALLAGTAAIVGTLAGLNELRPEWQTAIGYLQNVQPNLNWFDASMRLLISSGDPNVDMAKRFMLHTGGSSVQSLQTWSDLAQTGLKIPVGAKPDDYVLSPNLIGGYFQRHLIDGGPGVMEAILGTVTLILAHKIHRERKGPGSEYSPEYAQVQRRYDLVDSDMIGQIETLLKDQKGVETYEMEQTYFDPEWCNQVLSRLFRGHNGQRKQALASIGLSKNDEIQAGEFRLVSKDGNPSIVLRVKRDGRDTFGKETYYADKGYPVLLQQALSVLAGHTEVTTVKQRTELRRTVSYTDPRTRKEGTTVAILNHDRYKYPQRADNYYRRVEVVVPALAGVKPEDVFPEFFTVLSQSQESNYSDKQIGYMIAQVKV